VKTRPKWWIKFEGSKNGSIVAHRWSPVVRGTRTTPYPGEGRWIRIALSTARREIDAQTGRQFF